MKLGMSLKTGLHGMNISMLRKLEIAYIIIDPELKQNNCLYISYPWQAKSPFACFHRVLKNLNLQYLNNTI
jgi:hypothetical protein